MTIYCFHELSNKEHPWCVKPVDFVRFAREHPNDEFHFDDGRKGIWSNWPLIAENLSIKPLISLVPNFIMGEEVPPQEQYSEFMSIEEIKTLINQGFRIASHGFSHKSLITLTKNTLLAELNESKNWLEDTFKVKIDSLTLPYGHINENVWLEANKVYKKIYALKGSKYGFQRELVQG